MTVLLGKVGKIFVRVTRVFRKEQSITLSAEGIVVRDGSHNVLLQLFEVDEIEGVKINKVTSDENYLVLKKFSGEQVAIGELVARGFAEFERAILASLRDFPAYWRELIDKSQANEAAVIWRAKSR